MKQIEWPFYKTEFLASQGLSPTFVTRFWSKVQITDGCWLWTAHLSSGYGRIGKWSYAMILAHVASWIIHKGPVPEGLCVLHTCDNPPCVRPDHLWLGTRDDNNKDRHNKQRDARLPGSKNPFSKLTEDKVRTIRQLYAAGGWSQLDLAHRFGVSERNIFFIVHRQHWCHVL